MRTGVDPSYPGSQSSSSSTSRCSPATPYMIWRSSRIAGRRAQQPRAPVARLLVVARGEERDQRERRVADPAEAVVPVAHAADVLRQRRRRRRDDAAGRRVRERLEHDQRAVHRVVRVALVSAAARSTRARSSSCRASACSASTSAGRSSERRVPREDERHSAALGDGEVRDRLHVFAARRRPACAGRARPGPRLPGERRRRGAAPTGRCVRSRSGSRAPSASRRARARPRRCARRPEPRRAAA